jgi:hypothetical protein
LRFWASASAAATMVLMLAKFKYFLLGSWAGDIGANRSSIAKSSLSMRRMLPVAFPVFQMIVLPGTWKAALKYRKQQNS